MTTMRKELESRWLPEYDKHGIVKTVKPHFTAAFEMIDSIDKKRAEVNADKRFSDVGRTDEMQKFATTKAPALVRARTAVSAAKDALQKQRVELAPSVKDKNDIARALLRQEVRSLMRTKTPMEAVGFAFASNDPIIMEAIFEVPSVLSNLTDKHRDDVLNTFLERNASQQIATIADQADAIELFEVALRAAEESLSTAAGVAPAVFGKWLKEKAPIDPRAVEIQTSEINAAAVEHNALALPYHARKDLIDKLLETNVGELRSR
jgi:hypothetical protein